MDRFREWIKRMKARLAAAAAAVAGAVYYAWDWLAGLFG